ncbi:NADH dehydrogenase [ubiquinone] 1 alpha subcomplex subunit 11-like [Neoarius graeffei]|uniref:NADH dehydrogenase [ubiquinone] 1 alpha subcomplex subunit 11-like n=1 Tax=Neoarius graeffei TaxID=443677 RepID=UPI00298BE0F3|nr:NADH dehydrogenase [ubiquinone] 1 alpha subcomplex subunit 11-like [Neoarius graeffei]
MAVIFGPSGDTALKIDIVSSIVGYWDLKEGKNHDGKTWITTKLGTALGLVGLAYHIVLIWPETSLEALTRAANGSVTMASLGAIFGITTCLRAYVRDAPDDPINYFLSGCASGAFLGAQTHSGMMGTTACVRLGIVATLTKVGKKEGWRLNGGPRL